MLTVDEQQLFDRLLLLELLQQECLHAKGTLLSGMLNLAREDDYRTMAGLGGVGVVNVYADTNEKTTSNLCYDRRVMVKYNVIIPVGIKPSPARYELSAAQLLAHYFKSDVEFISRSNYQTPDFLINGVAWELKSPTGIGKNNIERQLQAALKQSPNIIFDARKSKIHISKIRSESHRQLQLTKGMKRLVLIEKDGNVIELSG